MFVRFYSMRRAPFGLNYRTRDGRKSRPVVLVVFGVGVCFWPPEVAITITTIRILLINQAS